MRYPLDALADALHLTPNKTLETLGVRGSDGQDYRRRGLTAHVAWRLAEKARIHPYEVWPELRDHELAEVERECANETCTNRFLPYRDGMHFHCSAQCRDAVSTRRYLAQRRQDPEFRARERERIREYRAEVRAARERRKAKVS